MASSTIWKPSTISSWKGGISFLADSNGSRESPVVTLPDGRQITGKYVNTNEGRHQWIFPKELAGMSDLKITYGGQTGTIANGATSYEGGGLSNWQPRAKGSIGAGGAGGSGAPAGFAPGSIGYGSTPAYLGGSFPEPFLVDYQPIERAPYEFTDPQKFAEQFGAFNRGEILKNFDLGKDIALKELDTELSALEGFVPVAANLKRQETSLDNIFNTAERQRSVDAALPQLRGQLEAQAGRAEQYARGEAPDSIADKALSYGISSAAADTATFAGTTAQSGAGRKLNTLMDAEARLKLAQFGEGLLGQTTQQQTATFVAPTEYSDAGQQVRVTPEVGAGRLTAQNLSEANALTTISPTTGLSSKIQQNQFETSNEQQTRMFNASNDLQAQTTNTGYQNNFALQKFNYDVGYAGALAGAGQTNINTDFAIDEKNDAEDTFNDAKNDTQNSNDAGSIGGAVGAIVGAVAPFLISKEGDNSIIDNLNKSDEQIAAEKEQAAAGLSASGIYDTPGQGRVELGNDSLGNPVYGSEALANSKDVTTGAKVLNTLRSRIAELGALDGADSDALSNIANTVGDPAFIANLDALHTQGKTKAFTKEISNITGAKGTAAVSKLADVWDRLSPAQKSASLATLGIQNFRSADGTQLGQKTVVPATKSQPGMNVSQAFKLASQGVNVPSLKKNWSQISDIQKVSGGDPSPEGMAETARQYRMLGYGPQGSAVPNISPATLAANGFRPAAQFGVGAVIGNGRTQIPRGYTRVGQMPNGAVVAMPTANVSTRAATTTTSGGTQQPQGLQVPSASQVGAQLGANPAVQQYVVLGPIGNQIYGAWEKLPKGAQTVVGAGLSGTMGVGTAAALATGNAVSKVPPSVIALGPQAVASYVSFQQLHGSVGGSAAAAGIGGMAALNTSLFGSVMATSMLGNVFGGKSGAQSARDSVRKAIIRDTDIKDYAVTLADGSKADFGRDGSKADYNIDVSSDLQYTAAVGGIALTRLLTGKKDTATDQVGTQLGNAALSNVGRTADYSQANYNKTMQNLRAIYAQKGIKTKSDAYQLANQAYAEGRISESDLISMHHSYNMIFDNNSYEGARRLMAGRQKGTAVAESGNAASSTPAQSNTPKPSNTTDISNITGSNPTPTPRPVVRRAMPPTKEAARNLNKLRWAQVA